MKKTYLIYLLILFFFVLLPKEVEAKKQKPVPINKPELADSILMKVMKQAPLYEKIVSEYSGEMYVKGWMNIKKKNVLLKLVPSMFRLEKGIREYMIEVINEMHYTAPDIYDLRVKALTGTTPKKSNISDEIQYLLRANVYSSSLLTDRIYSPLAQNAQKYYKYYLDTISGHGNEEKYKVLVVPRNNSSQLVGGHWIINNDSYIINEMYIEGELDFYKFKLKVEMGTVGNERYLPKSVDADVAFNFVGNKIDATFSVRYQYDEIMLSENETGIETKKNKYDLTDYFSLTLDSTTSFSDSAYFARIRPIPLTSHQEALYESYALRRDTTKQVAQIKKQNKIHFARLDDLLLGSHTVDMSDMGTFRISPLLSPLSFSYSPSNGFSYKQQFRYQRLLKENRRFEITPKIGYNLTRSEFYWSVDNSYDYWPKKRGSLNVSFGSGNRIYSSDVLDDIKNLPDSIFDFDKLQLNYFKDLFFIAKHEIEVMNGFKVSTGIIAHRRTPIGKLPKPDPEEVTLPEGEIPEDIPDLPSKYISFAPRIRVEVTPGMYYYMNDNRKINLYSRFPTFIIDWERGIDGILGSSGKYERFEFDMQHKLKLGLMRTLSYRAGFGLFTEQEQMYFVDFANFSRSNLPVGWNDDIGGVFQLLDGRWYNSSLRYVRAHLTYEAPFLFWPHLNKYTKLIENERIYLSGLIVPHLYPYIEIGYGIGTHIFDFGVFVSNTNGKFDSVGVKFSFELFRK